MKLKTQLKVIKDYQFYKYPGATLSFGVLMVIIFPYAVFRSIAVGMVKKGNVKEEFIANPDEIIKVKEKDLLRTIGKELFTSNKISSRTRHTLYNHLH